MKSIIAMGLLSMVTGCGHMANIYGMVSKTEARHQCFFKRLECPVSASKEDINELSEDGIEVSCTAVPGRCSDCTYRWGECGLKKSDAKSMVGTPP